MTRSNIAASRTSEMTQCDSSMQSTSKTASLFLPSLIVAFTATFLLFRSLVSAEPFPVLWGNDLDPRLISWCAEWGFQKLFIRGEPLSVFNANIFYPHPYTLAYSDSLLSMQLFYGPLRLFGFSPYAALYATLVISTLCGSLLTARAAARLWKLTSVELALVVFCAHFSLPFITSLNHYQLFGFHFAPALILSTLRILKYGELRDLIEAALLFAFGTGFAMYLAPMSVAVLSLVTFIYLLSSAQSRVVIWKLVKTRQTAIVLTLIVGALYITQLRPYYLVKQLFPPQPFTETWTYSARPLSIFSLASTHSFWYQGNRFGENGDWERAIFPGYLLLSLAAIALLHTITSSGRRWVKQRNNRMMREKLLNDMLDIENLGGLACLLLALCYVFSLGPFWDAAGNTKLPYFYFAKFLPGLESLRAPGRFGMLMGLPLGLAAVAVTRALHIGLLKQIPKISAAGLTVATLFGVIIESLPVFDVYKVPHLALERLHRELKQYITTDTPIIEFPTAHGDLFGTLKRVMAQMNGANIHGGKLVVGYAAKTTRESSELIALDGMVQRNEAAPEKLLEFVKTIPVYHIAVDRTAYPKTSLVALEATLREQSEQRIELLNGAAVLYILKRLQS